MKILRVFVFMFALLPAFLQAKTLNVYTLRQPELIEPIIQNFMDKTGYYVKVTWVKDGMLARLQAEGKLSPADVVISNDVARMQEIEAQNLLLELPKGYVNGKVPASLISKSNTWFAISTRSRVIVADKSLENYPKSYEDLALEEYKGKICIRSAKHSYNLALISSMMAHKGYEPTKAWLTSLKQNLARKPQGGDRDQVRAIYNNQCSIAVVNSYYLGKLATNTKEKEQQEWYKKVRVIYPNQESYGAHVNASTAGVLKSSKNVELALEFVDFLLSKDAQEQYAGINFEFPVMKGVKLNPIVESWGSFKKDELNFESIFSNIKQSAKLVDEVKFDF